MGFFDSSLFTMYSLGDRLHKRTKDNKSCGNKIFCGMGNKHCLFRQNATYPQKLHVLLQFFQSIR